MGVAVVIVGIVWDRVSRQLGPNMSEIEAYVPELRSALAEDDAFTAIEVQPITTHLGSIDIRGTVENDAELDRLRALVASTSPPWRVNWFVEVEPDS
jgi:hypothetical protein